jgi:NAD(P)-dependent dehydrogenase (short-subunit alcohol dehydrogenase family)
MLKKPHNKDTEAKAKEIMALNRAGEELALDAVIKATEDMSTIVAQTKTKQGRIDVLMNNAVYIGIGDLFMKRVADKARTMERELIENTSASENEAKLLAAIWLGKVFKEINEGVNNRE